MIDTPKYSFDDESQPAAVPMWREALTGLDYLQLKMSPVYYGLGVPRGDGSAVISIPGFMGSDLYLTEFRWWLSRIGYRALPSRIGRNVDCIQQSGEKLLGSIEEAYESTNRPVHLVGHSLGGILARGVAGIIPDKIASVTTLGSPLKAIHAHPAVIGLSEIIRNNIQMQQDEEQTNPDCFSAKCSCSVVTQMQSDLPAEIRVRSIFTRTDGVVFWEVCLDENPANNMEVSATHCGLAFSAAAYRGVASFLKEVSVQQKKHTQSQVASHRNGAPVIRITA